MVEFRIRHLGPAGKNLSVLDFLFRPVVDHRMEFRVVGEYILQVTGIVRAIVFHETGRLDDLEDFWVHPAPIESVPGNVL